MLAKMIDVSREQIPAADEYAGLLQQHGVVILRHLPLDAEGVLKIASHLGTPISYRVKADNKMFGSGPITYLKGEENESMSLGRDMLPLHNDGVVFKQKIDYLILYCYEMSDIYPGGDTVICDQKRALKALSSEQLHLLKTIKIEYLPVNESFHDLVNNAPRWVETQPIVVDKDGSTVLAIEFPYPDEVTAGWRVRVQSWSETDSKRFLRDIEKHMRQDVYCYTHQWQCHDFMMVNNVTTLHARHHLHHVGYRRLMRCHIAAHAQG
jgi:alpha-ketoglutarate-dependent taurine dioxygenase